MALRSDPMTLSFLGLALSLSLATPAGGQEPRPTFEVDPRRYSPSAFELAEIHTLIDQLTEFDSAVPGVCPDCCLHRPTFSPQPFPAGWQPPGRDCCRGAVFEPLQRLVRYGPKALPALVAALEDGRPTAFLVELDPQDGSYAVGYGIDVGRNQHERTVLRRYPDMLTLGEGRDPFAWTHHVTVGDLCFAAIGQITGRRYDVMPCLAVGRVDSPPKNPRLAAYVTELWGGREPSQALARWLWEDLGSLEEGSGSVQALWRLCAYFPDESAGPLAARLKELADWKDGDRTRVLRARYLWGTRNTERGDVARAALHLLEQAGDPSLVPDALSPSFARRYPQRARELALWTAESSPSIFDMTLSSLLISTLESLPKPRPVFEAVLRGTWETEEEQAMAHISLLTSLRRYPEAAFPWSVDLIAPLLEDPGTCGSRRVRDEAARALALAFPQVTFDPDGDLEQRDEQTRRLQTLAGR